MFWSMSFQLLPGEAIIDSTDKRKEETGSGIKPSYSVFLTNKRVVFRFDSLRTSMTQSFQYGEILEAGITRRLFITYLSLRTKEKTHYLHVDLAEHWRDRILAVKEQYAGAEAEGAPAKGPDGDQLLGMLKVLRKSGILTEAEYTEKAAAVREKFR